MGLRMTDAQREAKLAEVKERGRARVRALADQALADLEAHARSLSTGDEWFDRLLMEMATGARPQIDRIIATMYDH